MINTGDEPLRLYTVYAPSHHAAGVIQPSHADAERDEATGSDEPPSWTIKIGRSDADQHA